jgi:hypothetical protein
MDPQKFQELIDRIKNEYKNAEVRTSDDYWFGRFSLARELLQAAGVYYESRT